MLEKFFFLFRRITHVEENFVCIFHVPVIVLKNILNVVWVNLREEGIIIREHLVTIIRPHILYGLRIIKSSLENLFHAFKLIFQNIFVTFRLAFDFFFHSVNHHLKHFILIRLLFLKRQNFFIHWNINNLLNTFLFFIFNLDLLINV